MEQCLKWRLGLREYFGGMLRENTKIDLFKITFFGCFPDNPPWFNCSRNVALEAGEETIMKESRWRGRIVVLSGNGHPEVVGNIWGITHPECFVIINRYFSLASFFPGRPKNYFNVAAWQGSDCMWGKEGSGCSFCKEEEGHRGIVGVAGRGNEGPRVVAKFRQFRWTRRSTWGAAGRGGREHQFSARVRLHPFVLGARKAEGALKYLQDGGMLAHEQFKRWEEKQSWASLTPKCQLVGSWGQSGHRSASRGPGS